jgi:lysophospholipase
MDQAPFFSDVDDGPAGGHAVWTTCDDGVRIRVGAWPLDGATGTVLRFPGRTEYVEKDGRAAADLAARGYATLAVDWRGQGLADRLMDDPMPGHVGEFADYQRDVRAVLAVARDMGLPEPWHLLAHSMGGCIGLRALHEGLPVRSACFTGPMWGIELPRALRPVAWALAFGTSSTGLGHLLSPGTARESYVLAEAFEDNKLTTDAEMYDYMRRQTLAHPELGLGGPSMRWLYKSLGEMLTLSRMPSPAVPCVTFVGTQERIVDVLRIRARIAAWPGARLVEVEGGEHEVMMEGPQTRAHVFDTATAFYDANAAGTRADRVSA